MSFEKQQPARCSEGESGTELNATAGDGGGADPAYAWIGNTRRKRARIQAIAGILEAGMVGEIDRIHPKLQIASFPGRDLPVLGQREVDIRQIGSTDRVSRVIAEMIRCWRCKGELVVPGVERLIDRSWVPHQVRIQSSPIRESAVRGSAVHNQRERNSRFG